MSAPPVVSPTAGGVSLFIYLGGTVSKLIVIEGIDGSGKTTQCTKLLKHFYTTRDEAAVIVSEGGSTALGQGLFEMIKWPDFHINKAAIAYMIAAARHQLVETQIVPYLENNTNVICDRFTPSGLVYGSIDCGLTYEQIYSTFPKIAPNAIFILDVQPHIAVHRMKDKVKDSFEVADWRVIVHRRQAYLKLAQEFKCPEWIVIKGEQDEEQVHKQIVEYVEKL